MARRNGRHGPTEDDLEVADLEGTTQVVGEYDYDTPSVDAVEQAETGYPDRPIPTEIVGPVTVDELPCRSGGMFTRVMPLRPTRSLLAANPLRKQATILSVDNDFRIGSTGNEAEAAGAGAVWPAGIPLVTTLADDIWVAGVAAPATVSVVVEHWAR